MAARATTPQVVYSLWPRYGGLTVIKTQPNGATAGDVVERWSDHSHYVPTRSVFTPPENVVATLPNPN